ncbi:unnamed protein product, partial [Mesorhabditis belari]|uniref:Uncharacterized protein n=1 Tax=Mesorhabditis belari TaxID=2138241 RepID=A0AAF3FLT7_9BILA
MATPPSPTKKPWCTTIAQYGTEDGDGLVHREMASPGGVNSLAAQFEQTARQQRDNAQQQQKKSPAQVHVVKPSPALKSPSPTTPYDTRVHRVERQVFNPQNERSVLQTTLVDIDPQYTRSSTAASQHSPGQQYIHETIQEEYHTIKRYTPTPQPAHQGVRVVPVEKVSHHVRDNSRDSTLRAEDTASSRAPSSASVQSTRVLSPVRTVVERYESHHKEETTERRQPMIEQIKQEIVMQTRTSNMYSDEESRTREQQFREEERRRLQEEERRRTHGKQQTTTIIEEETFEEIRIRRRKKQDGQHKQNQERLRREAEERERLRIEEEERLRREIEENQRIARENERHRREEEIRIQEELHYRRELEIIEQQRGGDSRITKNRAGKKRTRETRTNRNRTTGKNSD